MDVQEHVHHKTILRGLFAGEIGRVGNLECSTANASLEGTIIATPRDHIKVSSNFGLFPRIFRM